MRLERFPKRRSHAMRFEPEFRIIHGMPMNALFEKMENKKLCASFRPEKEWVLQFRASTDDKRIFGMGGNAHINTVWSSSWCHFLATSVWDFPIRFTRKKKVHPSPLCSAGKYNCKKFLWAAVVGTSKHGVRTGVVLGFKAEVDCSVACHGGKSNGPLRP